MKIKKTMLLFIAMLTIPCVAVAASRPVVVYMYDKYFSPASITVSPHQKVVWVNKGKLNHDVTSNFMASGRIAPGGSVSYTFDKRGEYFYKCGRHSLFSFGMTGDVIVK